MAHRKPVLPVRATIQPRYEELADSWRRSVLAGLLFVPYLAWVSFASVLNFTIWRLNA